MSVYGVGGVGQGGVVVVDAVKKKGKMEHVVYMHVQHSCVFKTLMVNCKETMSGSSTEN